MDAVIIALVNPDLAPVRRAFRSVGGVGCDIPIDSLFGLPLPRGRYVVRARVDEPAIFDLSDGVFVPLDVLAERYAKEERAGLYAKSAGPLIHEPGKDLSDAVKAMGKTGVSMSEVAGAFSPTGLATHVAEVVGAHVKARPGVLTLEEQATLINFARWREGHAFLGPDSMGIAIVIKDETIRLGLLQRVAPPWFREALARIAALDVAGLTDLLAYEASPRGKVEAPSLEGADAMKPESAKEGQKAEARLIDKMMGKDPDFVESASKIIQRAYEARVISGPAETALMDFVCGRWRSPSGDGNFGIAAAISHFTSGRSGTCEPHIQAAFAAIGTLDLVMLAKALSLDPDTREKAVEHFDGAAALAGERSAALAKREDFHGVVDAVIDAWRDNTLSGPAGLGFIALARKYCACPSVALAEMRKIEERAFLASHFPASPVPEWLLTALAAVAELDAATLRLAFLAFRRFPDGV